MLSANLQEDLNSLINWTINNHLSFNLSKLLFMSFHRKFNSQYIINDHIINESPSCKDLGIIFTNSLSWRKHYEMISSKAYKSLGLLRRVFKDSHCPQARKSLCISLVRYKLLYCSTLWRPYLLKDIELIEKVQRRATKFILSDYTSDYRTRLTQLGMLPLMYIYEISDILFFIKLLKTPTDKFNILNYVSFNTGSTRSSGIKLHHKTAHTNAAMNSYFFLPT